MDMKTAPLSLLNDPTLLKTDALINGQWVKGAQRFDVHDPATGQKLADVANLGPTEAEQAIAIVKKYGTASASLLQRRMRIGYPRAARLMVLADRASKGTMYQPGVPGGISLEAEQAQYEMEKSLLAMRPPRD